MKSIITKRLGLTAGLTGALFAAGSLQAQTFEPGIDFTADVASTYIFRGADLHQNKFTQDKKSISSFNAAPAFQPSLTFKFAEGWSLNVWGSFALVGRNDVDSDELLQGGPGIGSSSYVQGLAEGNLDITNLITTIAGDPNGDGDASDALSAPYLSLADGVTKGPGFHKEANGLKRSDEVDLTLSYSTSSKLGTMTGGVVSYNYVNYSQQTASDIEMFVGFSPAVLPELALTSYVNVATPGLSGSSYNYLSYTKSIEIGKDMSLAFAPGIAYATNTKLKIQGWQNANLPVTLNMGGFHVGVTGVYRTDMRFFDGDTALGDGVAITGGSTIHDGLVADPGKNTGIGNAIANYLVQQQITSAANASGITGYSYSYTPRQQLPKLVYYYTIGYTMSF